MPSGAILDPWRVGEHAWNATLTPLRNVAPALARHALVELLVGGIEREVIALWLLHPGGQKVIDRVQESLGLSDADVALSRHVLRNYGKHVFAHSPVCVP